MMMPTSELYTLSLHDALPISDSDPHRARAIFADFVSAPDDIRNRPAVAAAAMAVGDTAIGEALIDEILRTGARADRKSTRLNSSHSQISYAVFCLKKKINHCT